METAAGTTYRVRVHEDTVTIGTDDYSCEYPYGENNLVPWVIIYVLS